MIYIFTRQLHYAGAIRRNRLTDCDSLDLVVRYGACYSAMKILTRGQLAKESEAEPETIRFSEREGLLLMDKKDNRYAVHRQHAHGASAHANYFSR